MFSRIHKRLILNLFFTTLKREKRSFLFIPQYRITILVVKNEQQITITKRKIPKGKKTCRQNGKQKDKKDTNNTLYKQFHQYF